MLPFPHNKLTASDLYFNCGKVPLHARATSIDALSAQSLLKSLFTLTVTSDEEVADARARDDNGQRAGGMQRQPAIEYAYQRGAWAARALSPTAAASKLDLKFNKAKHSKLALASTGLTPLGA